MPYALIRRHLQVGVLLHREQASCLVTQLSLAIKCAHTRNSGSSRPNVQQRTIYTTSVKAARFKPSVAISAIWHGRKQVHCGQFSFAGAIHVPCEKNKEKCGD